MSQRVLVADDSPVARLLLARRLRAAGLEVVEHASAASAAGADPSDLTCALLDYDLGDGLGSDVAIALRARRPELPIAFFTTSSDLADKVGDLGPVFAKPDEIDAAIAWVLFRVSGS
jgi:DNA-binding response OmpR family regulator